MTTTGWVIPVRAKTLSRIAQKRASRPARSPASTQCLDIFCPPPGTSEVISHFERLSSNEMKMAPICVWIAAGSSCGSSDIGSLQSESDRNLSLPHDRPLSTPHGIFAALPLAMTIPLDWRPLVGGAGGGGIGGALQAFFQASPKLACFAPSFSKQ